jgi:hypothetical protein
MKQTQAICTYCLKQIAIKHKASFYPRLAKCERIHQHIVDFRPSGKWNQVQEARNPQDFSILKGRSHTSVPGKDQAKQTIPESQQNSPRHLKLFVTCLEEK